MAAKYRKVDPRIWDDEVFDALTSADAFAVLWLETCRGLNRAGVAVVGLGEASDKLRLQGVDEAWDTLSRVCPSFKWPLQKVGRNTVVIILRTWFKYNEPTNPDHLKGMLSDLLDVPRCELLSTYSDTVKPHLDEKWHDDFDRVFPELSTPCGTPCVGLKQKLDTEESIMSDSDESNGAKKKNPYTPQFELFWQAFPKLRRTSKGKAWNAWKVALGRVDNDDPAAYLLGRAIEYAKSDKGSGEFVQMPSSWLTGRCWEDAPEAWNGSQQKPSKVPSIQEARATYPGATQGDE